MRRLPGSSRPSDRKGNVVSEFAPTNEDMAELREENARLHERLAVERKRHAELWALADDENMKHLLVWQRVKKRAEAGGFNGMLASDFRLADQALAALTDDLSREEKP